MKIHAKKLVSLLLTFVMLLSIAPFPIAAAPAEGGQVYRRVTSKDMLYPGGEYILVGTYRNRYYGMSGDGYQGEFRAVRFQTPDSSDEFPAEIVPDDVLRLKLNEISDERLREEYLGEPVYGITGTDFGPQKYLYAKTADPFHGVELNLDQEKPANEEFGLMRIIAQERETIIESVLLMKYGHELNLVMEGGMLRSKAMFCMNNRKSAQHPVFLYKLESTTDPMPDEHNLTVESGTADNLDGITGNTESTYSARQGREVTLIADTEKDLVNWESDSPDVWFTHSDTYTWKITMPDHDVTVRPVYYSTPEPSSYNVWVQNGHLLDPAGGTITTLKYAPGETVTVVADQPQEGYEFLYWYADPYDITFEQSPEDILTASFVMPKHDVIATAKYEEIPVQNIPSVKLSLPLPMVGNATADSMAVTSDTGYGVDLTFWSKEANPAAADEAVFVAEEGVFAAGARYRVTITLSADPYWQFSSLNPVYLNGVELSAENITISEDGSTMTLQYIYQEAAQGPVVHSITVNGGKATKPVSDTENLPATQAGLDEWIDLTADPAPDGQRFSHWEGYSLLDDPMYEKTFFRMPDQDVVLTAVYEPDVIPIIQADVALAIPQIGVPAPKTAEVTYRADTEMNVESNLARITWTPVPPADGFAEGQRYKAEITITAPVGYVFGENTSVVLNHDMYATVLDHPNSYTDTIKAEYEFQPVGHTLYEVFCNSGEAYPVVNGVIGDTAVYQAEAGDELAVIANDTQSLIGWESDSPDVMFTPMGSGVWMFVMPRHNVLVMPVYKDPAPVFDTISQVNLTVPEPAIGSAMGTVNTEDKGYTISYSIWDPWDPMGDNIFAANQDYRISMELLAGDGYEFAPEAVALINGVSADSYVFSDKTTMTVEYVFPAMKPAQPKYAVNTVNCKAFLITDGTAGTEPVVEAEAGALLQLASDFPDPEHPGRFEFDHYTLDGEAEYMMKDRDAVIRMPEKDILVYAMWKEHAHQAGEWIEDGDRHYKECTDPTCGYREIYPHNFSDWTTEYDSVTGKAEYVRYCYECGARQSEPAVTIEHTHETDGVWHCDASSHWQTCKGCGANIMYENHDYVLTDFDGENDVETYTCSVCGHKVQRLIGGVQFGDCWMGALAPELENATISGTESGTAVHYDAQALDAIRSAGGSDGVALQLKNVTGETADTCDRINPLQDRTIDSAGTNAVYSLNLYLTEPSGTEGGAPILTEEIKDFGEGTAYVRVPVPAGMVGMDALGTKIQVERIEEDGSITVMESWTERDAAGKEYVCWKTNSHSIYMIIIFDYFGLDYFGMSSLTELQQKAYERIDAGVSKKESVIDLFDIGMNAEQLMGTVEAYRADHPDQYTLSGKISWTSRKGVIVSFKPTYYSEPVDDSVFQAEAAKLMTAAAEKNTEYAKALALHDVLSKHVTYENTGEMGHSAYGAIADGKAVCEGYAKAYQYLLQQAGIQSYVVSGLGNGGGHAWNLVRLDGQYYYSDVTWDDPSGVAEGTPVFHAYFNLPNKWMEEDHEEQTRIPLPTENDESMMYHEFVKTSTANPYTIAEGLHKLDPEGRQVMVRVFDTSSSGTVIQDASGPLFAQIARAAGMSSYSARSSIVGREICFIYKPGNYMPELPEYTDGDLENLSSFAEIGEANEAGLSVTLDKSCTKGIIMAAGYDDDGRMKAYGQYDLNSGWKRTIQIVGQNFDQVKNIKLFLVDRHGTPITNALAA